MQSIESQNGIPKQYNDRTALAHLREMHISDSRAKHPNLPYHTSPIFSASKTNDLTRAVLHFLKLKGHFCEKTGNEGRCIDKRKTYTDVVGNIRTIGSVERIKSSGMNGTSDLKAIIKGRFVAIEIKNNLTHDRQRPGQKHYQQEVEASEGLYVICTSFAQFVNWYYANYGGVR